MNEPEHVTPEEQAKAKDGERIEDLDVREEQAEDVSGGTVVPTENVTLNKK